MMTKAELEARNLSLGQLMMLLPENENDIFARELQHRLIVACKIAVRLEDSLFYAETYRDWETIIGGSSLVFGVSVVGIVTGKQIGRAHV